MQDSESHNAKRKIVNQTESEHNKKRKQSEADASCGGNPIFISSHQGASLSDEQNTSTSYVNNSTKTTRKLKLYTPDFSEWTKPEVCSLLQAETEQGGAGMSNERVQSLYDFGFDGTHLKHIAQEIRTGGKDNGEQFLRKLYESAMVTITVDLLMTFKSVVTWIDELLQTKKLINLLYPEELKEIICGPVLTTEEFEPFQTMTGSLFCSNVVNHIVKSNCTQVQFKLPTTSILYQFRIPNKLNEWAKGENTHFFVKPKYNLLPLIQGNEYVSRLLKLGVVALRKTELSFVTEQIIPFINEFEGCISEYEARKTSSITDFNCQMDKLGLANAKSLVYIFPNTKKEKSTSCESIVCTFAPTFPKDKYKEREEHCDSNNVLTCIEAPGTGKTHFAFHLASLNKLVAPLLDKHVSTLFNRLKEEEEGERYREQLDTITATFAKFYHGLIILLVKYAEVYHSIPAATIKQYVLRFLWNGGGTWVAKQKFNFPYVFPYSADPVIWILDEVQTLCYPPLFIAVPHRNVDPLNIVQTNSRGNLLTLLAASFRGLGPLVLTTTFYSSIEDKIETLISEDTGKYDKEKFSHQLRLLPLLSPQQVLTFLEYFITIPKDNQLWKYVSFMLQGTIRNTESFLQQLYVKATLLNTNNVDVANIVNESLYSIFMSKIKNKSECESECESESESERFEIELKMGTIPYYKYIFYKLAISGEVTDNFKDDNDITTYLMRNGISFTFEHAKKVYKLTSCIEKAKMLNYIFYQYDWFDKCYNILTNQNFSDKKDISLLAEVFVISLLKDHYESCILPLLVDSYSHNYKPSSSYFFEDSEVSNLAKDDIKFSSLMINCLASDNISLTNIISKFFARPGQYARVDILGMLKRNHTYTDDPNFIPLTVAISRFNSISDAKITSSKILQDFATTNISNMYLNNISSTPTPSGNDLVNDERKNIESSLKILKEKGKAVRIMFHPNEQYSNTLEERIKSGTFGQQQVQKKLTDYSVILDDNSCLIEISSGIEGKFPQWESFMKSWKRYFLLQRTEVL